ncbi:tRNA (adenosine(37)-N6)-threonylcarbamoyltransferase complex transferase subunit TsaD [Blattabacterium cuenoti]|uniref:tRNA (adenosine(37)-N6)-threonylcarbamoyltransferase complex transferase subunit TsaD n=1 Tax=Blattabacterium cuenoti TaxID=1653831 RepID=UPI00163BF83E|nr:tRNA (adenosine(37)-N6)-threonylcarbamoyltransferase complex transferase subunit TsaD [Blattabacterium cuenoti]
MKKKNPIIIGIESSCDETAVSIVESNNILSNIIIHQNIHKKYGGVVPELAARLHDEKLLEAFNKSIFVAKIKQNQIDAVSCTIGPGLINSLLVGCSFSKSLAMGLNIPIITVDHIQAHILVHFIKNANFNNRFPTFPFLGLVISGGHTQIIKVNGYFYMKVIGSTLDNALGETIDKIARKIGFNYPGGSSIEIYSKYGNNKKFFFPKPLIKGLNFSFSGLKTYILKFIENQTKKDPFFIKNNIHDLCASIQKSISDILIDKMNQAVIETDINRIVLSGGVSSNKEIINNFSVHAKKNNWDLFIPKKCFATDNGAMIAITGFFKYKRNMFSSIKISPYSKCKQIYSPTIS